MTAYSRSPTNTAGCWSTRSMPRRRAAFGPSTSTRSARRECPASKTRPLESLRPHRGEQARRRRLHRQLDGGVPEWVVDRHRADELASDVDLGQRPGRSHAVQPPQARLGVPRQHLAAGAARPRGRADHDVRGRQGVEAPDDLVARRLGEPERGDEGTDADDRAEHGQRDAGRPRHEARGRLAGQVARRRIRRRVGLGPVSRSRLLLLLGQARRRSSGRAGGRGRRPGPRA